MIDQEHTCRICRGEATESQPLFHPCNCRGSIKYIHQDCLFEWLKHSNKSTKRCDICNSEYKFKTIYDPSMPSRIPFQLIWSKLVEIVSKTLLKSVSVALYLIFLLQLPFFWKFAGRIYSWAIDGTLPVGNSSITNALLFGGFDITKHVETLGTLSPSELFFVYGDKILQHTYYSGVRHIFVFIIVHVALFVEHEWVVRDEGYTKSLMKKIGKEPRTKLVDMLQQALTGLRNDGANGNADAAANLQHLELLARAIGDLQPENQDTEGELAPNTEEALRRAIAGGIPFLNQNQTQNEREDSNVNIPQAHPEPDRSDIEARINQNDSYENADSFSRHSEHDFEGQWDAEVEAEARAEAEANLQAQAEAEAYEAQRHAEAQADAYEQAREIHAQAVAAAAEAQAQQAREEEERAEEEALEAAQAAAAANGGAGDFLELFGFVLNIKTPIFLMALADLIITSYLFVFYFIPHMLGNAFASLLRVGFRVARSSIFARIEFLAPYLPQNIKDAPSTLSEFLSSHEQLNFVFLTLHQYFYEPIVSTLRQIFIEQKSTASGTSLLERLSFLSVGYALIAYVIFHLMRSLVAGSKPTVGTSRKIYKVLFEITSTAKVFFIFAIEIFFFPVYCGWLLDFCGAPLFLKDFIKTLPDGSKSIYLLFTSITEYTQSPHVRLYSYWAMGTFYMLWFALFVGMVRGKILRPGVLFFIRSPEDPNARLIHDALVKPLMLQLSRIYLSAKVYTGFILVGIGGVTWCLRLGQATSIEPSPLTPSNTTATPERSTYATNSIAIIGGAILMCSDLAISPSNAIIKKYCHIYWKRVFEISTHKLRLSHFILGKAVSQERGYIVYRNLFDQLFSGLQPDYSQPTTYRDASTTFDNNPQLKACFFVPNGSYVRVPDNDTVSRKFVKKLFVQVTKDDKLISKSSQETSTSTEGFSNVNSGYDTPTSDEEGEEFSTENAYTIVYRPPNFKLRCLGLVCMLWVFAVLLIVTIFFAGLIVGRPVVRAFYILRGVSVDFKNTFPLNWEVDIFSLVIGLRFMVFGLKSADKIIEKKEQENNVGRNEVQNPAVELLQNQAGPADVPNVQIQVPNQENLLNLLRGFLPHANLNYAAISSSMLWFVWSTTIHIFCIDFPFRFYFGSHTTREGFLQSIDTNFFLINRFTILVHLGVSFWTYFGSFRHIFETVQNHLVEAVGDERIPSKRWFSAILINAVSTYGPVAILEVYLKLTSAQYAYHIYKWPAVLAVFIVFKIYFGVSSVYTKMQDLVKNEKYVRGRTIENVEDER